MDAPIDVGQDLQLFWTDVARGTAPAIVRLRREVRCAPLLRTCKFNALLVAVPAHTRHV